MGNSFFSNSNRGEILNKLAIASKLIMGKSLVLMIVLMTFLAAINFEMSQGKTAVRYYHSMVSKYLGRTKLFLRKLPGIISIKKASKTTNNFNVDITIIYFEVYHRDDVVESILINNISMKIFRGEI